MIDEKIEHTSLNWKDEWKHFLQRSAKLNLPTWNDYNLLNGNGDDRTWHPMKSPSNDIQNKS